MFLILMIMPLATTCDLTMSTRAETNEGYDIRQLWDLFQPKRLFLSQESVGQYSEARHLAEMISIMGPPPLDFLHRCGEKAEKYWEKNG